MHRATRAGLIGHGPKLRLLGPCLIAILALGGCEYPRSSGRIVLPRCAGCGSEVDGAIALGATARPEIVWFTSFGETGCWVSTSAPEVIEVVGSVDACSGTIGLRGVANGRATIGLGGPRGARWYTLAVSSPVRGAIVHATDPFARIDPIDLEVQLGARLERRVFLWDILDRPLLSSGTVSWSVDGSALSVEPDGRLLAAALGDATLRGTAEGFEATLLVHVLSAPDYAASSDCAPQSEVCNLLDEDCDGLVDEDPDTGPICENGGGVSRACVDGVCAPGRCGAPWRAACGGDGVPFPSDCHDDLETSEHHCGRCFRACSREVSSFSSRCVDRLCIP